MMQYYSTNHCPIHSSPFECPDWLILFDEKGGEHGIVIHDGGQSYVSINYCPWCGKKLSKENDPLPRIQKQAAGAPGRKLFLPNDFD